MAVTGSFDDPNRSPKKPKTGKQSKANAQWGKFASEDRIGRAKAGKLAFPNRKQGQRWHKVADALGRQPNAGEIKQLKQAHYNQFEHTVSFRRRKDGTMKISVKKKRKMTPKK